jgi:hypothetical protein
MAGIIGVRDVGTNSCKGQFIVLYGTTLYAFLYNSAGNTLSYKINNPGGDPIEIPAGVGDQKLHVLSSVDNGATWVDVDSFLITSVASFGVAYTVCVDGDTAYIVHLRTHLDGVLVIDGLTVTPFDLSTETLGASTDYATPEVGKISKGVPLIGDGSREVAFTMVRRGAGDMILLYSGPPTGDPSIEAYGRVYCATFDGTTFTELGEVPGQAGDITYWPISVCVDSGDIGHLLYRDNTVGATHTQAHHVGLDPDGTFGTPQTVATAGYLTITPGTVSNIIRHVTGEGVEQIAFASLEDDGLKVFLGTPELNPTWSSSVVVADVDTLTPQYFWWMGLFLDIATNCVGMLGCSADADFYTELAQWEHLAGTLPGELVVGWTDTEVVDGKNVGRYKWSHGNPPVGEEVLFSTPTIVEVDPADYDGLSAYAVYLFGPLVDEPAALALDCDDPPGGTVGIPYSHQISISGGTPPYTATISDGALPNGLSMDTDGLITGTPTLAGTFTFTVHVEDAAAETAEVECEITIIAPSPLVLGCDNPPDGTVLVSYSHQISITGGVAPYTVVVVAGSLPPGLDIDNAGLITGIPTAAGVWVFTLRVTDSAGVISTVVCTIVINQPGVGEAHGCIFFQVKNPNEPIYATLDFSRWLNEGDAIQSVAWSTLDGEVTILDTASTPTTASVLASMAGATDNDTFTLKCRCTTQRGLVEVRRVEIWVRTADYPTRSPRGWWRLR